MSYVHIRLKAKRCNMLQSSFLLVPAPVFAAVQTAAAIDWRAKGTLKVSGVGIVHHDAKPVVEYIEKVDKTGAIRLLKELPQQRGAVLFDGIKSPSSNSIQPQALANLEWSLILHTENPAEGREGEIRQMLSSMRFAGGTIESTESVKVFDALENALRHVGSGYWVEDVTTEKLSELPLGGSPLKRLLTVAASEPWVVPVNLGYSLLEEPQPRSGSRDGRLHAFAEHLIGLVKFTSLRRVINRVDGSLLPLWKSGWVGSEFVVSDKLFCSAGGLL